MATVGQMKPIKIIQSGSTADTDGFRKPTESVLFAGWAKVRQANGFREFQQGLASMGSIKEFEIRNNLSIKYDADTRLIYAGKRFAITSIEPKKEERFWWIIRANELSQ